MKASASGGKKMRVHAVSPTQGPNVLAVQGCFRSWLRPLTITLYNQHRLPEKPFAISGLMVALADGVHLSQDIRSKSAGRQTLQCYCIRACLRRCATECAPLINNGFSIASGTGYVFCPLESTNWPENCTRRNKLHNRVGTELTLATEHKQRKNWRGPSTNLL